MSIKIDTSTHTKLYNNPTWRTWLAYYVCILPVSVYRVLSSFCEYVKSYSDSNDLSSERTLEVILEDELQNSQDDLSIKSIVKLGEREFWKFDDEIINNDKALTNKVKKTVTFDQVRIKSLEVPEEEEETVCEVLEDPEEEETEYVVSKTPTICEVLEDPKEEEPEYMAKTPEEQQKLEMLLKKKDEQFWEETQNKTNRSIRDSKKEFIIHKLLKTRIDLSFHIENLIDAELGRDDEGHLYYMGIDSRDNSCIRIVEYKIKSTEKETITFKKFRVTKKGIRYPLAISRALYRT